MSNEADLRDPPTHAGITAEAWTDHERDDPRLAQLLAAKLGDPFGYLGLHAREAAAPGESGDGGIYRCFLPWAATIALVRHPGGDVIAELVRVHPDGLFAAELAGSARTDYRLRVTAGSDAFEIDDPYRFGPVLGEIDIYLLAEGRHYRAFEKLGAHPIVQDGVAGVAFAVWAPNATSVSVVGSFNDWDGRRHPMRKHLSCGVWDLFYPDLKPGEVYKFQIHGPDGALLPLKADPYADEMEYRPSTASVIAPRLQHDWHDSEWMAGRGALNRRDAPISIYEVHLGSWRRRPEEGNRQLGYRELANELVPYVSDLGFTHLQTMPVSEYPFDGSWGYQPIGLFAPTRRFGTPADFAYFVDACHAAGLALWIDWVPGHFPTDAHGLGMFDGTHLYEHADPRQGFHQDWNTLIFNYGRREVQNYLIANALSWVERYHVDGLRVDAVASMLYLDYSRKAGEWIPNEFGGRENLAAIAFLKHMNEQVFAEAPGATTAAEESTAWPMVSAPVYLGGLGFGYKWNMGWMHDTLHYMAREPIHRRFHHNDLTFGLLYAFSENFILPLSHDEVVYGKGSLLGKMPGDRWQRFANLRAYYGFMWTHPGKKLLFMGGEFGQEAEWNHDGSLDWHLLDDPMHRGVQTLMRDLNRLYRAEPALYLQDAMAEGFAWVDGSDSEQSVVSYLRYGTDRRDAALVVCNFTPQPRHGYRLGVPWAGHWDERLNTDAAIYGGSDLGNYGGTATTERGWHGQPYSVELTLPPLSTSVFVYRRER